MDFLEKLGMVLSVIGIIAAVISTQHIKYEDRKSGKRWWEDTPNSR